MMNVILSRLFTLTLAYSVAVGPVAARADSTGAQNYDSNSIATATSQKAAPSPDEICQMLDLAKKGTDEKGKPFVDSKGKEIDLDKVCKNQYLQTDARAQTICRWRALAQDDQQAPKYCEAKKLAKKSMKGLIYVAALDTAAAATCALEASAKKKQIEKAELAARQQRSASRQANSSADTHSEVCSNPAAATAAQEAKTTIAEASENSQNIRDTATDLSLTKNELEPRLVGETKGAMRFASFFPAIKTKLRASSASTVPNDTKTLQCQANTQVLESSIETFQNSKKSADELYASAASTGACGGLALAAGLGELAQVTVLNGSHNNAGDLKFNNQTGQVDERETQKLLKMTLAAGATMEGLRIAACYYNWKGLKNMAMCPKTSSEKAALQQSKTIAAASTFLSYGVFQPTKKQIRNQAAELEEKANNGAPISRATNVQLIAKEASIAFGVLAGLRWYNYLQASGTVKKADEALAGLVSLPSLPTTGGTANGVVTSGLGAQGGGTTGFSEVDKSAIVSQDLPESKLLPRNSPLGAKADGLVSGMTPAQVEKAMSSGGPGMMAAQMAASAGAGNDAAYLADSAKRLDSYLANLPGMDQGKYAASGGGALKGKSSGDVPAMNLAGIFGGQPAEQGGAGDTGIAFRGPAAESDIWHSDTDRNLFQIVSGKYEAVTERVAGSH